MSLNKSIIEEILGKSKSVTLVAKEFGVSRKTIYKWIREYHSQNIEVIASDSKKGNSAHNRISSDVESMVISSATSNPALGIVDLRDKLEEEHGLKLNPTTVYRILKRNNVRYVKGTPKVSTVIAPVVTTVDVPVVNTVPVIETKVEEEVIPPIIRPDIVVSHVPVVEEVQEVEDVVLPVEDVTPVPTPSPYVKKVRTYVPRKGVLAIALSSLLLLVALSQLSFTPSSPLVHKSITPTSTSSYTVLGGTSTTTTVARDIATSIATVDSLLSAKTPVEQVTTYLFSGTKALAQEGKGLSLVDTISLKVYCSITSLFSVVKENRCNYDTLTQLTITTNNYIAVGTTSEDIPTPTIIEKTIYSSGTTTYVTNYVNKYIPVAGPRGPAGVQGPKGDTGMTGSTSGGSSYSYFSGPSPQYIVPTSSFDPNNLTLTNTTLSGSTNVLGPLTSSNVSTLSTTTITQTLTLNAGLIDSVGTLGTGGQVLSTTGTSTKWITMVGGGGGSIASGTVLASTLYWDGSAWSENTTFLSDTSSTTLYGALSVVGTSTLATTSITSLTSTTGSITNLTSTNATTTNLFTTNATSSSLFSTTSSSTNLTASFVTVGNATATNFFTTSLRTTTSTSTSFFATEASFTNATTSNFFTSLLSGAGLTSCSNPGDKLLWANGTFTCGADAGAGGGITNINGAITAGQTFATSSTGGLTIDVSTATTTGVHTFSVGLLAGYSLPLTASTTDWNSFFSSPNSYLTAGSNIVLTSTSTIAVSSTPTFTTLTAGTSTLGTTTVPTLFATLVSSTDLFTTNATTTNLVTTNLTGTNSTITNSTSTTFFSLLGSITSLLSTNATTTNLFSTSTTLVNATSSSFFSTLLSGVTAFFTNLTAGTGDISTLTSSSITTGALTATGTTALATTTVSDLTVSSGTISTLTSTTGSITNLSSTNATATNLVTTNSSNTNATSTNLAVTNGTITNGTSTNYFSTNSSSTNLTASFSVVGNATSTNFFTNVFSALSSFFTTLTATNATIATLTSGTSTLGNATSTTLSTGDFNTTNSVAVNSTSTNLYANNLSGVNSSIVNSTSTNFFTTLLSGITAFFSNLTSGSITGGSITATSSLASNGTLTVLGTTSLATTTISNLNVTGATSTFAGAIQISQIYGSSSLRINGLASTSDVYIGGGSSACNGCGANGATIGVIGDSGWSPGSIDMVIANPVTAQMPGNANPAFSLIRRDDWVNLITAYSKSGNVILGSSIGSVAIGATTTPYAKLTLVSSSVSSTTFAIIPRASQTANIIDIFNTSGVLTSVLTASGNFGLGTTTPTDKLQVAGNITPNSDLGGSLGSSTLRFLNLYAQNVFATSGVITNSSSTNFFSTNTSFTNATSTSLFSTILSFATGTLSQALQVNGVTVLNSNRDLLNIGTISTTGAINSQTISNTASFTGSLAVAGAFTASSTLGVTGASTLYSTLSVLGNTSLINATATSFAITGLTSGSIPFIGTGGTLSENNSQLYWDNTNGRLGVGTSSPSAILQVGAGTGHSLVYDSTNAQGNGRGLYLEYQNIPFIGFQQYMTGASSGSYGLFLVPSGTIANSGVGIVPASAGNLAVMTSDGAGLVERMRVDNRGNVAVGTSTPSGKFSIQGVLGSSNVLFDIASTTSSAFATSSLFTVLANGNVGIGTANPTTTLEVGATGGAAAKIRLNDVTDNQQIIFANGGVDRFIIKQNGAGLNFLGTGDVTQVSRFFRFGNLDAITNGDNSNRAFSINASFADASNKYYGFVVDVTNSNSAANSALADFRIGGTSKVFFDVNGSVGIGTTSPTDKLQVAGNITPNSDLGGSLGSSTLRFLNTYVQNIFSSSSVVTNSTSSNFFTTNLSGTSGVIINSTSTSLFSTNGFITNSSSTNLFSDYGVTTNSTSSNFFTTSLTSTNIFGAGLSTSCNIATEKLLYSTTTGQFFCGTDAGGAGGSITSLNGSTVASQSFATSTTGGIDLVISTVVGTGVHTFTANPSAGYAIPLIASSSNWNSFFNSPVSYLTAGSNIVLSSTSTIATSLTPTFTSVISTNGTSTNFFATSTSFVNGSSTNFFTTNLGGTNSVVTNSTSTTGYFSSLLTVLTGVFTNLTSTYATFGTATTSALIATGTSTLATTTITNASVRDLTLSGFFKDTVSSMGTLGQVLLSTGTSTIWTSTSSLGLGTVSGVTGGALGFATRWLTSTTLGTSTLLDNGTVAGINATSSSYTFNIQGSPATNPFNVASSSGASLFTVLANGNVGVGTTTPSGLLTLVGSSTDPLFSIMQATSSSPTGALMSFLHGYATTTIGSSTPLEFGSIRDFHMTVKGSVMDATNLSTITSIVVSGRYAYTSSNSRVSVIDIGDPSNPAVVGSVTSNQLTSNVSSIAISGQYVYATVENASRIVVIDISNPTVPKVVGSLTDSTVLANVRSLYISGKYAYTISGQNNPFAIVDISNPIVPKIVGSLSDSTIFNSSKLVVVGKYAYVAGSNGGLTIIDISNPSSPVLLGSNSAFQLNIVHVSGRYAYGQNSNRFKIYDVSNPSSISVVGSLGSAALFNNSPYGYLSGHYWYTVSSNLKRMFVIDVASSTNPVIVSSMTDSTALDSAQNITISGRYAYVGALNRLTIVDLAGIDMPNALIGNLQSTDIAVWNNVDVGNNLYVRNGINIGQSGLLSNGAGAFVQSTTTSLASIPTLSAFTGDSNSSSIVDVLSLGHGTGATTTTSSAGIGAGLLFTLQDASGGATSTSRIASVFTNTATTTPFADLAFYTKSTTDVLSERLRITSTGNVGIGTSSPTDKLQVAGNITPNSDLGGSLGSSTLRFLNLYAQNIFATSGVITNSTSSSIFTVNLSGTNSIFTNSTTTNLSTTNSTSTNLFSTNSSSTNATSSNFFAGFGVTTNSTSTNLFSTILSFATGTLSQALQVNGTTIINSSRDLLNIGTITSGLINGQTISSTANFTGSLAVAGAFTASSTLAVTGITTLYDTLVVSNGIQMNNSSTNIINSLNHPFQLLQANSITLQTDNANTSVFTAGFNANTTVQGYSNGLYPVLLQQNGGNVGIGTSTPSGVLSVQSQFGNTKPLFDIASTTSSAGATSSIFTVLANGNVGVGVSNPTSFKLQVAGNIGPDTDRIYDLGSPSNQWRDLHFFNSVSGNDNGAAYVRGTAVAVSSPAYTFINNTTSGLGAFGVNIIGLSTDGIERIRIDNIGNVGIGTSSPTDKLQVAGNITPNSDLGGSLGSSTLRFLNLYAQNIFATSGVITNSTSTNFFSTNIAFTNASSTNFFTVNSSSTNATSSTFFSGNGVTTNSTSTNLFSTILSFATGTLSSALQVNGVTVLNSSRDLLNIGTISTTGAINSQTISNTANFTGSLAVAGASSFLSTLTVGTTSSFGQVGILGTLGSSLPLLSIASTTNTAGATSSLFTVLANGNVGIGTSSPSASLSIMNTTPNSVVFETAGQYNAGLKQTGYNLVYDTKLVSAVNNAGLFLQADSVTYSPILTFRSASSTASTYLANGTGVSDVGTQWFDVSGYNVLKLRKGDNRQGNVIISSSSTDDTYNGASLFVRNRWDGDPALLVSKLSNLTTANLFKVTAEDKTTSYFDITSVGNIGIGTSTPLSLLSVASSTANGTSQLFAIATSSSLFTVLANGNVGIGTSSPATLLHINGLTEQLRLSYDASNFTSFTENSSGTLLIDSSGNSVTIAGSDNFLPLGGFQTSATTVNSNMYVPNGSGVGGSNSTASLLFGGASDTQARVGFRGSNNTVLTNNVSMASLLVGQQAVTEATSGNHPILSQLAIRPLAVTAGASTVTNSATIYIENSDNTVTTDGNYSLWVDNGTSRFDGNVLIGTSTPFAQLGVQGIFGSSNPLFNIASTTSSGFATSSLFIILANGNVGVGTTTPSALLTLVGSSTDPLLTIMQATSSSPTGALMSFLHGYATTTIGSSTPQEFGSIRDFHMTVKGSVSDGNLSSATAVFVSGRYAYVASFGGNNLAVVDISNPATPVVVGSVSNSIYLNTPRSVFVSGKYAYVASGGGDALTIVDISNPVALVIVGSISNSTILDNPYSVSVSGSYAYITALNTDRLTVVDISKPTAPVIVGSISDSTNLDSPTSVYVSGKYAYVTGLNAHRLSIVDISNPTAPAVIGSLNDTVNLPNPISVSVSGRYAYAVSNTGKRLTVVDVSNPKTPVVAGSVYDAVSLSSPQSVSVSGRYAYVVAGTNIAVVDVSTPSSPSVVSSLTNSTSLGNPSAFYISGRYAYVLANTGSRLTIIDLAGIDMPTALIGNLQSSSITAWDSVDVGNNLSVRNGINIGQGGLLSNGAGAFVQSTTTSLAGIPSLSAFTGDSNSSSIVDVFSLGHGTGATSTASASGIGSGLLFSIQDASGGATSTSRIASILTNVATSTIAADLAFFTKSSTNTLTEWMRLTGGGRLSVGTSSPSARLSVLGTLGASTVIFDVASTTSSAGATSSLFTILANGKSGFGTSTPSARLSVLGTFNDPNVLFDVASTITAGGATTSIFTVLTGGFVGIGTTTPGFGFVSSAATSSFKNIIPEANLTYNLGATSSRFLEGWISTLNLGTSTWSLTQSSDRRFSIFDAPSGAGTERLSITTGGNVGIGTSTPGNKLTIAGDVQITGSLKDVNNSAGSTGYVLQNTGSGIQWVATSSLGVTASGGGQLLAVYSTSTAGSNVAVNFNGQANSSPSYSAGTLTLPSNASYIIVKTWGAGGEGGNGSTGATGGSTCFGTNATACTSPTLSAAGGVGGGGNSGQTGGTGGAGGTASGGDINISGNAGGYGIIGVAGTTNGGGGTGGSSPAGGGGGYGNAGSGGAFGGGGGGNLPGGATGGAGGAGGGGYSQKLITNPNGNYYYTVGAGGSSGQGGVGGAGGLVIEVYTSGVTNGSIGTGQQGQFAFYNASGTSLSATSNIFKSLYGDIVVGTTSSFGKFSVLGTLGSTTPLFSVASTTSSAGATSSLFTILANGNVGVGTSSPQAKLHVTNGTNSSIFMSSTDNSSGFMDFSFVDDTSANQKWGTGVFSDSYSATALQNAFYFYQSRDKNESFVGKYRMVINDSGNVIIGSTTPQAKLGILGTLGASTVLFDVASTTSVGGATSSLFTVLANGNVGIGTTTPTSGMVLQNSNNNTAPNYTAYTPGSNAISRYRAVNEAGDFIDMSMYGSNFFGITSLMGSGSVGSNKNIVMYAGDSAPSGGTSSIFFSPGGYNNILMTINANGRVGIGTTSPQAKLGILGTFGSSTVLFDVASTTSAAGATSSLFTVLANGNVGIGTTSPSDKLGVSGVGSFTGGIRFGNSGSIFGVDQGGSIELHASSGSAVPYFDWGLTGGDYDFRQQLDLANNSMNFLSSTTASILTLKGNGNVGVGTTTPATKLSVEGSGETVMRVNDTTSNAGIHINSHASTSYSYLRFLGGNIGNFELGHDAVDKGFYFNNNAASGATNAAMYIASGGNIGIGTSTLTSNSKLQVVASSGDGHPGLQIITPDIATTEAMMLFSTIGNQNWWLGMNNPSTNFSLYDGDSTGGVGTRFTVNNGGEIGIGTESPIRQLHLNGPSGAEFSMTGPSKVAYINVSDETGNDGGTIVLRGLTTNGTAGAAATILLSPNGGNVGIGDTSPDYALDVWGVICQDTDSNDVCDGTVTSDSRLKTGVTSITGTDALQKLSLLHGVEFNWDETNEKTLHLGRGTRQIGLIAQEVESVFPSLIYKDMDGYRMVDYQKLTGPLISAVNELNSRTSFISNNSSTASMYIDSNGRIGIGENHPLVMLSVSDTGTSTVARFSNQVGYCDIDPKYGLVCTTDDSERTNVHILDSTSTNAFSTSTHPLASTTSSSTLDKLTSLHVVTYTLPTTNSTSTGLVLDEVKSLFPDLVSLDSVTGKETFSLTNLIPYIIQSIKQLTLAISDMKNIFVTRELCVGTQTDKTCLTKQQVDQLLLLQSTLSASAQGGNNNGGENNTGTTTPPTDTGTSTPPTDTGTSTLPIIDTGTSTQQTDTGSSTPVTDSSTSTPVL